MSSTYDMHTKSLCSTCLNEVEARIVEENGAIYLNKRCPDHGDERIVIERDAALYKLLAQHADTREGEFGSLFLPLSNECDLACAICCFPDGAGEHDTETIKNVLSSFNGKVRLSGGEPTMRSDLPDILRFLRERKLGSVLITNGLRLADEAYLKELIDAGLEQVAISINGFRKEHYQYIHNDDLLKRKKQALANLKKNKVPTVVSTLLVKGVNDDIVSLRAVYQYCLAHNDFIQEWRLRPAVSSGRHVATERIYMADLIGYVQKLLGVDRQAIIDHYLRSDRRKALCRFSIDCFGLLSMRANSRSVIPHALKKLFGVVVLMHTIGTRNTMKAIWNMIKRKKPLFRFLIELRVWPDKYTIDLAQMKQCLTAHLGRDLQQYPCCYYTVIDPLVAKHVLREEEK